VYNFLALLSFLLQQSTQLSKLSFNIAFGVRYAWCDCMIWCESLAEGSRKTKKPAIEITGFHHI